MVARLYNSHKRMTKVIYNKMLRFTTTKRSNINHPSCITTATNKQKEEPLLSEEEPLSGEELTHLVMSKNAGNIDNNKEEELSQSFCSQSTSATATTTMPDGDGDGTNHKAEEEEDEISIRILPPAQEDIMAKLVFQYCNSRNDEGDTTSNKIIPTSSAGVTKCNTTTSTNSRMMTKCYMVPIPTNIQDGEEFYVKAGTTRVQLICPQYHNNQSRNKNYYNTMVFELVPCTCRDCTASTTLLSDNNNKDNNKKQQHHRHQRAHHRHRQQHYPNLCHLRVVNDIQFLKFYNDIEQHNIISNKNQVQTSLCWTKGWNSFTSIHVKQIQIILLGSRSSTRRDNNNIDKEEYNNHINEICIANVPKQYQTIVINYIMYLIQMNSHNKISSCLSSSNINHSSSYCKYYHQRY